MLHSYTNLLGETLSTARFALIGDGRHEFLYLGDTLIKKYEINKYSLKAVKRYCRLYLLSRAKVGKKVQLTMIQSG